MAAISHYLAKKLLDHVFGNTAYTAPSGNLTLKLFTATPSPSGGGTEVSAGGYSAKTIANNTTNFPDAVLGNGEKFLNTEQSWTASADWGTVTAWGLYDGSNLLCFAPLDTPKTVNNTDTFKFAAGASGVRVTVS